MSDLQLPIEQAVYVLPQKTERFWICSPADHHK
jgi:hypothetical protein